MSHNDKLILFLAVVTLVVLGGAVYLFLLQDMELPAGMDGDPAFTEEDPVKEPTTTQETRPEKNGKPNNIIKDEETTPAAVDDREGVKPDGLNLIDHAQVVGKVVDNKGNALTGVEILLYREYYPKRQRVDQTRFKKKELLSAYSDEGGAFIFFNVPAPAEYELTAVNEGYASTIKPMIKVRPGQMKTAPKLVMGIGWTISGAVLNVAGVPIAGATVFVDAITPYGNLMEWETEVGPEGIETPAGGKGAGRKGAGGKDGSGRKEQRHLPWKRTVKTDEKGQYRFPAVSSGTYEVGAWAKDHALAIANKIVADASNREKGIRVDFSLDTAMTIQGRVLDQEDRPIPGVEIRATRQNSKEVFSRSRTVSVKPDGRFVLSNLRPGRYMLSARKMGYLPNFLSKIKAGAPNALIVLKRAASVTGKVMVRGSGKSAKEFLVAVCSVEGTEDEVRQIIRKWQPVSSPNGTFKITGLQRGRYRVAAKMKGSANGYSDAIQLEDGQVVGPVMIRLNKGHGLKGKVVNLKGKPIAGARAQLMPRESLSSGWGDILPSEQHQGDQSALNVFPGAATGKKGIFQISDALPGIYSIKVTHPDYDETYMRDVVVASGRSNYAGEAILHQGGTLVCKIFDKTGSPLPKALINVARTDSEGIHYGRTDHEGILRIVRMKPGAYHVQVTDTQLPFEFGKGWQVHSPTHTTVYIGEGETTEAALYMK